MSYRRRSEPVNHPTQIRPDQWPYRAGRCPFCDTEQDFQLAADVEVTENYLRGGFLLLVKWRTLFYRLAMHFYLATCKDVPTTPLLSCVFCSRHFFQCPFCKSTSLAPQEFPDLSEVHCRTCKRRLLTTGYW